MGCTSSTPATKGTILVKNFSLPKQEYKNEMCPNTKTNIAGATYMMSMPMDGPAGFHNMTDESIPELRVMIDGVMGPKFATPGWKKYIDNCVQTECEFVCPDEGHTIKFYTATRMTNVGKKLPVCINAHQGGCCIMTAKDESAFICKLADQNDMIFINLEFRNAPECKAPGGAKDMFAAIKYLHANAEKYNIDPSRISISGSSGGGNVCLTALILLARENKSNLCKAAFLWCPMINSTMIDVPKEQCPEWEQGMYGCGSRFCKIMCTDPEAQKEDLMVYPGKVTSDELKTIETKIIPMNAEFD
jgi:hypothetical protein